MRVLFAAPRIPWPLDTGGKIRTFHLLSALARRFDTTLVAFHTGRDPDLGPLRTIVPQVELVRRPDGPVRRAADTLLGLAHGAPVTVRRYAVTAMADKIRRICDRWAIGALHLDSLCMAQYGEAASGTATVLDEHNVEARIWERLALVERRPARRLAIAQQAGRVRRYEVDRLARVDRVLCCSEIDHAQLEALHPGDHYRVVPNGVALDDFTGVQPAPLEGTPLVFVGSMDWAPNAEGVAWFADTALPAIRKQVSDAVLYVVGRRPPPAVQALTDREGIVVTGSVPSVAPYVAAAAAVVVPLRSGSGTRLKILEAFAASKPVVSTTVGAEGIEATSGEHLLVADDPDALVEATVRVLRDAALAERLAHAGRALVETHYSWETIGGLLAQVYEEGF